MRKQAIWVTLPICAAIVVAGAWLANAGPLAPPAGPVDSTGRFGPRTEVNQANTPGDVDAVFVISVPGSYYLPENIIGITGMHGIKITADDVTLDLNGFAVIGVPGSLNGVHVYYTAANQEIESLVIRNGTVRDWAENFQHGVYLANLYAVNARVEGLRVSGNNAGISARYGGIISNCTATGNISEGIYMESGSVINCSAYSNGGYGIYGWRSTIVNCTVNHNTDDGIHATLCTVTNCTANENSGDGISARGSTVTNCSAYSNTINGISVSQNSTVTNCTVNSNDGHGIDVGYDSLIVQNTCLGNGGVNYAGIGLTLPSSSGNRIEANNVTDNHYGIHVTEDKNLIIKNTASGNTTNYEIAANNRYGPIIDITASGQPAVSGNSAASTVDTTDPWANFSF
jgi:parallel beta-helix repeat protein